MFDWRLELDKSLSLSNDVANWQITPWRLAGGSRQVSGQSDRFYLCPVSTDTASRCGTVQTTLPPPSLLL